MGASNEIASSLPQAKTVPSSGLALTTTGRSERNRHRRRRQDLGQNGSVVWTRNEEQDIPVKGKINPTTKHGHGT